MAVAGDGKPRSEQRQRTGVISIRVTEAEKSRMIRRAQEAGYPSLSAWVMDHLDKAHPLPLRCRIRILAWIGRIDGALADLCERIDITADPAMTRGLDQLGCDAVDLQNMIMEGGQDAGKGDP